MDLSVACVQREDKNCDKNKEDTARDVIVCVASAFGFLLISACRCVLSSCLALPCLFVTCRVLPFIFQPVDTKERQN